MRHNRPGTRQRPQILHSLLPAVDDEMVGQQWNCYWNGECDLVVGGDDERAIDVLLRNAPLRGVGCLAPKLRAPLLEFAEQIVVDTAISS